MLNCFWKPWSSKAETCWSGLSDRRAFLFAPAATHIFKLIKASRLDMVIIDTNKNSTHLVLARSFIIMNGGPSPDQKTQLLLHIIVIIPTS